jgi:glycosyltransferase involved in cell wall biosynthesis
MRILHVTPYYQHAWAYGGIPRIATALAQTLSGRGHQVTVCTTDAATAAERIAHPAGNRLVPFCEADARGVAVRVFPNLSNRLAYHLQLFVPLGLSRFLRAHAGDFDVAHIHACHNLLSVVAGQHLSGAGVPYVLAPNGTAPRIERRLLAKYLFDALFARDLLPCATILIAVSAAERIQFHDLGIDDERIRVVPNPVDLSEFDRPIERGRFRQQHGLGPDPVIMFLGKLTPRKGLDVLARAFARLNGTTRLVIVGNDMGYGKELARLLEDLNISQRTIRIDLLTGHDRLEALADADVVCYPSKDEIFGLVPIEAILAGTPVVVADDSGCGEVIRSIGGGRIVPQGQPEPLALAISELLTANAEWRSQAARAATRARVRFAATTVGAQLEAIYQDAIAQGSRHGRHSRAR